MRSNIKTQVRTSPQRGYDMFHFSKQTNSRKETLSVQELIIYRILEL